MRKRRRRAARDRRARSSASRGPVSSLAPIEASGAPSCAPTLEKGGAPPCALTLDGGSVLLTLITHQDLIAKLTPNRLVNLSESRLKPDLRDVPRSGQIDLVGPFDGSRPGGKDDNTIGERDRLLEVVGNKDDRGGG